MKRWGWLLGFCLLCPVVEAGIPRTIPPVDDAALQNFLKSLADHLNTLECLTVNPDGLVLGTKGELKCATYGGSTYACMNVSETAPNPGTDWACFNGAGGGTIIVQNNDVTVDAAVSTVDFSSAFTTTSSPAGEANIGLDGGVACSGSQCAVTRWSSATTLGNTGTPAASNAKGILITTDGSDGRNNILHAGIANLNTFTTTDSGSLGFYPFRPTTNLYFSEKYTTATAYADANTLATDSAMTAISKWEPASNLTNYPYITAAVASSYTGSGYSNTTANRGAVVGLWAEAAHQSTTKPIDGMIGVLSLVQVPSGYNASAMSGATAVTAWTRGAANAGKVSQANCLLANMSMSGVVDNIGVHVSSAAAFGTNVYGLYIEQPSGGSTKNASIAIQTLNSKIVKFDAPTVTSADQTITLPDATGTVALTTNTSDITINKADPTVIYDVVTASDTDFWAGVQDDAGGDDDDVYQIGKGTTPGTTPLVTVTTAGRVAIKDTTPTELFTVGTSDNFTVNQSGQVVASGTVVVGTHLDYTGTSPSVSACGAAPNGSVVGKDQAGKITIGGGVVTSCTLTFATPFLNAPACVTNDETNILTTRAATTTTTLTLTASVSVGGDTVSYLCEAYR